MTVPVILPVWRPELVEPVAEGDLTWAYPWPAGERLAADLAAVLDCRAKRIAEIGCGRGRCGLTALALGAESVLLCDAAPEPLAYVEQALAANRFTQGSTCRHMWGEPLPAGHYDVIIGADILYRPALHRALLSTIASSLSRKGVALLADPRSELEAELPALAGALGLTWEVERRPGNYTLIRCHRG